MKNYSAIIVTAKLITPTVLELVLSRPNNELFFNYKPGQYVTLSFPGHKIIRSERSFSLASSPSDRRYLRLGIRIYGRYTQALKQLKTGDHIKVSGPFGEFIFRPDYDKSMVLFAGGIGITPFLSMIYYAADMKLDNKIILFYCIRSMDDCPYHDELNELEKINSNFRVVYVVSDGELPEKETGKYFHGRINEQIIARTLNNKFLNREYLMCGPPAFMHSVAKMLIFYGVSKSKHRHEKFGVASTAIIEPGTPIPKFIMAFWGVVLMIIFVMLLQLESARRSDIITTTVVKEAVPSDNTTAPATNSILTNTPTSTTNNSATAPKTTSNVNTNTNLNTNINSGTTTATPVQPRTNPRVIPRTQMS